MFLTGATGGLGGCLLYKLALELPTKRIFVLCRSKTKARASWAASMPLHINAIFNSGKIELVIGDITKESFGIAADQLAQIASQTNIVINSAADISLAAKLLSAIHKNCLPPLELARLACSFQNLHSFVQISTGYSNSHLPDGPVEEAFYPIDDAELELEEILSTGTNKYAAMFPRPYAYSKHIMERLLSRRYPNLPILIVRPTIIGSAVKSPFPSYGPPSAMPLESLYKYCTLNPGSGVFHPPEGHSSGMNLFDEIPVDWVANLTLLHIAAGTTGPVHAASETWFRRTFDEGLETLSAASGRPKLLFVADKSLKQCFWAELFAVTMRDWNFSTKKADRFRGVGGVLSIDTNNVELAAYDRLRVQKVRKDIENSRSPLQGKL